MKIVKLALLVLGSCVFTSALASTSVKSEIQSLSPQISAWAEQSSVVNLVQKANTQHSNYTKTQIKTLNKQWQQELNMSNKPLISGVMNNELSALLEKIQEHSNGLYQGIVVTDAKGLNVGQTYVPGQYWQAGQTYWKKAFATSPGNPYVFQGSNKKGKLKAPMIALPILDAHNNPIGVVAVNINLNKINQSTS
ncbi:MAG: hypothetical protein K0R66_1454 [Gammaproteobacteria bacterium]|jgi:sensor histidine kinase regulating citrate/malate metabolism|nr:hypothetical protein [Gammaproteobacteria bacterium]